MKRLLAIFCLLSLTACGGNSAAVKTRIVTNQVAMTPHSCILALNDAEALIHGPVLGQLRQSVTLLDLIQKSYQAGVTGSAAELQQVITGVHNFTANTKAMTNNIRRMVLKYNQDSANCRNSTGTNG